METVEAALDKLWSRRGMYIAGYNQKFDAAGLLLNFLSGVLYDPKLSRPTHIDIAVVGTFYSVRTSPCQWLAEALTIYDIERIFDVLTPYSDQLRSESFFAKVVAPITWFTDACTVELCTLGGAFSYTSYQGKIAGSTVLSSTGVIPPYIGISFTVSQKRFEQRTLDVFRLRQAIIEWKAQNATAAAQGRCDKIVLSYRWRVFSNDSYTVRAIIRNQEN
jgi:hypothetical protein